MRYTKAEIIWLAGRLPSGTTVTMEVYDLEDGSTVALDNDSCAEIAPGTGLYRWPSSDLTSQPAGFTQYVYTMVSSPGNERSDGKFILGDPDKVSDSSKILQTWINVT